MCYTVYFANGWIYKAAAGWPMAMAKARAERIAALTTANPRVIAIIGK